MNNDEPTYLKQQFSGGQVDRENHVIRGVKILSVGEMKGHGFHADRTTLEQTKNLIPSIGLKAKVNHRGVDGVMTLNGRVKAPYIEGSVLKGDWHLNPGMPTTPGVLALALHQPEDAGFSLTCHKTLERIGGKDYMRMTVLKSCDLVEDPAGNSTLLSSRSSAIELEARMENAATELEAAEGIDKVALAQKFEREFGKDWKKQILAGDQSVRTDSRTELADVGDETALVVEPHMVSYLKTAEAEGIALVEVENRRRSRVMVAARAPGANARLKVAAFCELRRLSDPGLEITGLEAIAYQQATGVPWSWTMQDFSDEDAVIGRSHAIARAQRPRATDVERIVALKAINGGDANISQFCPDIVHDEGSPQTAASGNMELFQLRAARFILDGLEGTDKSQQAAKYSRSFGSDWRQRLEALEGEDSGAANVGNTDLQAKMEIAVTQLEAVHGVDKVTMAVKFDRQFGKGWRKTPRFSLK